ncbi:MAG: Tricarboxylate transport protein TctC [Ramlibacter sp.]|nr:Tricarboxylate transport protein TctC [Ramlibacter sp.]
MRIVIPAPPGGNLDATGRMLAHRMTLLTGETHIVDNRPGGNTQIGMEWVARSRPDGRVMLLGATGLVFVGLLQKLGFSPMDDLAPVIQVSREGYVLLVGAAGPGSIKELEALAAVRPGGLNCVTPPGATALACEQLKPLLQGQLTVVPYVGVAPALNAMMAGFGDLMFANASSASKLVESGRLRALAVSGRQGLPGSLSQLPLLSDLWPGFLLEGTIGLFVPAGTPEAKIRQLNQAVARILADPEVSGPMRESGQEPVGGSPQRFAQELQRAHQRYAEIIQRAGLGPR